VVRLLPIRIAIAIAVAVAVVVAVVVVVIIVEPRGRTASVWWRPDLIGSRLRDGGGDIYVGIKIGVESTTWQW
jgi:hypothetical protein